MLLAAVLSVAACGRSDGPGESGSSPVEATPESIAFGERVFTAACVGCHGPRGDGQGPLAKEMELAVPDLTSSVEQQSKSDAALFVILTEGHGGMPGQGDRWGEERKWDIINYIRTLDDGAE